MRPIASPCIGCFGSWRKATAAAERFSRQRRRVSGPSAVGPAVRSAGTGPSVAPPPPELQAQGWGLRVFPPKVGL